MRLIPPTIDAETPSTGERHLYELLAADEAHPNWIVLHSQDIAAHRRQLKGEADFVVVVPGLGVLVIEVKGCRRLNRSGGLWYYGSDPEGDPRGPFRQASEAMHSLRERLGKHRRELGDVLWASAVCFPFIPFTEASEEWHSWQVIDVGKLDGRPIDGCITAVLCQARKHAAERRVAWFDPGGGAPTPAQCEQIVRALRPDFEFYESPKARARRCDEEIRHYTQEQYEALDSMRRMPRVVFDGPAGTGKTLLALEATRRAQAEGRSVLLLCYNRPLAEWLGDQAAELCGRSPQVTVRTVHQYMTELAGGKADSGEREGSDYFDRVLPQAAAEQLLENADTLRREGRGLDPTAVARRFAIYDELVVDEAQDVVRDCFLDVLEFCLTGGLAGGVWRMFGDFAWQTIYDDSVSLDGFCRAHGGGCALFDLDENCRNTPRVAGLACRCGHVEPGYAKVLRPDDGVEPGVRFYKDIAHQRGLLVRALEELRQEGFTGPQVVILSMRGDANAAAGSLKEPPWGDRLEPLLDEETRTSRVDARSGKIRYSSIHRFKGLEASAVVMTDVERVNEKNRALLYVGATRTRQRLIVLAHESLRGELG